eukprot:g28216.t1
MSLALHSSLEHLDIKDTHVKLLLVDYSSAFNTIIPSRLISTHCELGPLQLNPQLSDPQASISEDSKTEELIINFKKKGGERTHIEINGAEVESVESVKSSKFLGVTITDTCSSGHLAMSIRSLTNFYRCTIESILSGCITAWYGNCSDKKLQKVVCTAQTITEANLPSMDSIYMARCRRKAANIIKDPSHP